MVTIQRATLVIPSVEAHMTITGTPDPGADGKDYRANSVHAPFSEKSACQAPPYGCVVRLLPVHENRLRSKPKRHYDECKPPSAPRASPKDVPRRDGSTRSPGSRHRRSGGRARAC